MAVTEGGCRDKARAELLDIIAVAEAGLRALDVDAADGAVPFKRGQS